MADPEAFKKLLDNKYILFGIVGLALLAGNVISKLLARFRDKMKQRRP